MQHVPADRRSVSLKEWIRPYYLKLLYFRWSQQNRPSYFRDCWNAPTFPLDRAERLPEQNGPDLLFLPMTDWHTRIQRTQHLARTFGEMGRRCLYLNPHVGREFPMPYAFSSGPRIGEVAPGVRELHLHLPSEPVYHHRLLSPSETQRLVDGLEKAIAIQGSRHMIQLVSFPIWMDAAIELRRRHGYPIIYDCHDLLSGFKLVDPSIASIEPSYLEQSDLVLFSSRYLENEIRALSPQLNGCLVRNGVSIGDFEWKDAPRSRDAQKRPVIGYVGALEFWFDVEAIRIAAEARPEWRFLLIGRIESAHVEQLRLLPNVTLAGEAPYERLRELYSQMDVALIPFRDLPLTQAANPIKLYEYFACGLPVVSAKLSEVELYSQLVYVAERSDQFLPCIERALEERDGSVRRQRRAVAERESWRARCEQIALAFDGLGNRQNSVTTGK